MQVQHGDVIEIHSKQVGGQVRRGRILELVSDEPLELRVEWEDGHESTLYPAGGMITVVDHEQGT